LCARVKPPQIHWSASELDEVCGRPGSMSNDNANLTE
jgi:hypothetical protein